MLPMADRFENPGRMIRLSANDSRSILYSTERSARRACWFRRRVRQQLKQVKFVANCGFQAFARQHDAVIAVSFADCGCRTAQHVLRQMDCAGAAALVRLVADDVLSRRRWCRGLAPPGLPNEVWVVLRPALRLIKIVAPGRDRGQVFVAEQGPVSLLRRDAVEAVLLQPLAHETVVGRADRPVAFGGLQRLGAANGERSGNRHPVVETSPAVLFSDPRPGDSASSNGVGVDHPIPACSATRVAFAPAGLGAFKLTW
jgi:hypothetical protein